MKIKNLLIISIITCVLMTIPTVEVNAAVTGLGESDIPSKYANDNYEVINCIDTSKWQGQLTADNWEDIKEYGVDAAFLRAGHTKLSNGEHNADSTFAESIEGAYDAGIEIGVYYFTTATTTEEAKAEAEFLLETIEPYRDMITLPVVFDFETNRKGKLTNSVMNSLGVDGCTEICEAFCDAVEDAGYDPMIYASKSVFENNLNTKSLEKKYKIWVASYPRGSSATNYSGEMYAWQYSSSVRIDGISGRVDADYIFRSVEEEEEDETEEVSLEEQYANSDEDSSTSDSYLKTYTVSTIDGRTTTYNLDNVTVTMPKKTKKDEITVNITDSDSNIHSYVITKKTKGYTTEEHMLATILSGHFSSDEEITAKYVQDKVEPSTLKSFREGRKLSIYGMGTVLEKLKLDMEYSSGVDSDTSLKISEQLAKGKPVILSVGGKAHLLLAMDEDGKAIEAKFTGDDRIAHVDIDELISEMTKKGSTRSLYYSTSQQNGYVLIDLSAN